MPEPNRWGWPHADRSELIHAARTAIAAMVSLLIGRLLRLPEPYWAVIATLIVMQSTLGTAWTVSKQRFAGTVLGAAMGALLATYLGSNMIVFGAGVFALGMICAFLRIERAAYRYAGVTLAIVMLVARTGPAWIVAVHRFVEISVGIAVALILTAIWREAQVKGEG